MEKPNWIDKLQPYTVPNNARAMLYTATSLIPYLALVSIMILLLINGFPYWMILLIAIPSVGFYIRTFMILHDCGHLSFLRSKTISYILGHICGILTFTPFFDWQRNHGIHHATVANLDKRGTGDVWTMTAREYRTSNTFTRFRYRVFRNPFFLFGLAPFILFGILYRFPQKSTRRKDYFSIAITDTALAGIIITAHFTIGLKIFFMVFTPVVLPALSLGMWLFYIQHQFENAYWAHNDTWNIIDAAIKGSSFYKLPGIIRWFSGNIGFHNIHHLKPRIPCYKLKQCYTDISELHTKEPITLRHSIKSLGLHLWDEDASKLIGFADAMSKGESNEQRAC